MSATGKTLAVLDCLGRNRRLADIADSTGLSKPTVHRILSELCEHGYARSDGHGSYVAGPRLLGLAGEVLADPAYARSVRPVLQNLVDETSCAVHFALLQGDQVVYVEKLDSPQPYRMASRIGMSVPLHCSAVGKAVLAHLPPAESRRLLDGMELAPRAANTITSVDALNRELARIKRAGYASDDEENEDNIRCVGAPVFDNQGRVIGAVSVSALAFEMATRRRRELAPLVVDAARQVSALFGAPAVTSP
jgi:DNA-binding IclR family transcriptional regulator